MKEKYELLRQTHQDVINCQGQASLAATIRDCQLKSDPPIEPPLTGEGRDGDCVPTDCLQLSHHVFHLSFLACYIYKNIPLLLQISLKSHSSQSSWSIATTDEFFGDLWKKISLFSHF